MKSLHRLWISLLVSLGVLPVGPASGSDDFPAASAADGESVPTAVGPAHVWARADQVPAAVWQEAFAHHAKDDRYYRACEQTLTRGFSYRYLLLRDPAGEPLALQPFFLHDQDLTAGLHPRWRAPLDWVRRRWPRFLTMRMLMVGCTAGEAHLGLVGAAAPVPGGSPDGPAGRFSQAVVAALLEALRVYARRHRAAVIAFKDFARESRAALHPVAVGRGYEPLPSFPATQLDLASYRSFEDYLGRRLGKATRKNLRRKFRLTDPAAVAADPGRRLVMEVVSDVSGCVDELYPLYQQVFARSQYRFEELTKDYFVALGRTMPERARFFLWRLADTGRLVAFSSCLLSGQTLYDNYLGLDYAVALDLSLYFVTIRDLIDWSIAQGVRFYYSTPLNYEPKFHLRFALEPLDLYVRHVSGWFNPVFGRISRWLEPVRYDRLLPRFENFADVLVAPPAARVPPGTAAVPSNGALAPADQAES